MKSAVVIAIWAVVAFAAYQVVTKAAKDKISAYDPLGDVFRLVGNVWSNTIGAVIGWMEAKDSPAGNVPTFSGNGKPTGGSSGGGFSGGGGSAF